MSQDNRAELKHVSSDIFRMAGTKRETDIVINHRLNATKNSIIKVNLKVNFK